MEPLGLAATRAGGVARRLSANATHLARRATARFALPREGAWLHLRLSSPVPELASPSLPGARPHSLSLLQVLVVLERAARDPAVAGLVLRLEGPPGGFSRVGTLRRALARFRESGKPVVVWAETLSAEELLAVSVADRILLPRSGAVHLVGLRFEGFFLKELLERVGVAPEVVRVGAFKSAAEMFTREGMSHEHREQLEELIEDVYRALVNGIAEGRGLPPETVRELVDRGPYRAEAAQEAGLIDSCLYPDEIESLLLELAPDVGSDSGVPAIDAPLYLALRASDPGLRPLWRELPRVAYVVASGAIHRGRGLRGVASDPYRELFERLREDDSLRGVLLRVDSPGGDSVTSDLLWRAARRIATEKPVVVSMGDVAASGGYYIAAAGDAILAEPATLTGSIGVVGGKLNLSELYERLGVRKDAVERGARAGLLSEARPFSAEERRVVRDEMVGVYELFLERVAEGRGLSRDDVHRLGQGRVWSGRQASALGLVDELGGPLEALAELRRRIGLGDGETLLLESHPRMPRFPGLRDLLPGLSAPRLRL